MKPHGKVWQSHGCCWSCGCICSHKNVCMCLCACWFFAMHSVWPWSMPKIFLLIISVKREVRVGGWRARRRKRGREKSQGSSSYPLVYPVILSGFSVALISFLFPPALCQCSVALQPGVCPHLRVAHPDTDQCPVPPLFPYVACFR